MLTATKPRKIGCTARTTDLNSVGGYRQLQLTTPDPCIKADRGDGSTDHGGHVE